MAEQKLDTLVICGSLRKGSYNAALARQLPNWAPPGMSFRAAPSFEKIPIYNFDLQQSGGFPADVNAWADAIRSADAIVIVSPEYNWSIPAGLKNAIDWLSRYKEVSLKDKPVVIQSTAGGLLGGARMQYHLRMALQAIDAQLFGKPEVIVNMAANKFADGKLTDQGAIDLIKQQLAAFDKFVARVKV